MSYELLWTGYIRRLADGAQIPPSPDNRDYLKYLDWVAAGNTAAVIGEPVAPPDPDVAFVAALDAAQANLDLGTAAGVRSAAVKLVSALKARTARGALR